jgi:hypothetical protein
MKLQLLFNIKRYGRMIMNGKVKGKAIPVTGRGGS